MTDLSDWPGCPKMTAWPRWFGKVMCQNFNSKVILGWIHNGSPKCVKQVQMSVSY